MSVQNKIIAQLALEVGEHTAESNMPRDYVGACAVVSASDGKRVIAVLPSQTEASRVAAYAITPDGGFGSVFVRVSDAVCTHESFVDWLWG